MSDLSGAVRTAGEAVGALLRSPVSVGLIGYVSTVMHTLRTQQHQARVARVGEQLKELYGPLLACVTASSSSYQAMLRQVGGAGMDSSAFRASVHSTPSGAAGVAYRAWVREVLMPLSERAARLVVERADLLESSEIEPLLLQLVAHVSAYKVILKQWEGGDTSTHSTISYPDGIHAWVADHFQRLKRRQSALLGINTDGKPRSTNLTARLVSRL